MNRTQSQHHVPRSTLTILVATLAVTAVLLIPTLTWDSAYDQGTFLYGGRALLDGARPYVDFWDIKPPNIFYTYSAALGFFGNSFFSIRLLDYLNALVTIALLFLVAMKLWTGTSWGRLAAVIASLAYVLQFYVMGPWNTAQAETYSMPWLLLAVLLETPERQEPSRERTIRVLLAGFAIAIAFFFKFPNGIFLLLLIAMLWLDPEKDRGRRMRSVLVLLVGFAIGVVMQVSELALRGGLDDLIHITTSATANYTSSNVSGELTILRNIRIGLFAIDPLWLIASILGWSLWSMENHPKVKERAIVLRNVIFVGLACFLAYFAIQIQNKGYTYHYQILLPWADVLVGAGIAHLVRLMRHVYKLPRTTYVVGAMLFLFGASILWSSNRELRERILAFSNVLTGDARANQHITSPDFIDYIESSTSPRDSIFIFGFDPYLYWRTGRAPANKFLNTIHFKPTVVAQAERQALVQSLTSAPPRLLLVETGDRYTSQGDSPDDSRTVIQKRYPEIERLLATRYQVQDTLHGVIAYHLR